MAQPVTTASPRKRRLAGESLPQPAARRRRQTTNPSNVESSTSHAGEARRSTEAERTGFSDASVSHQIHEDFDLEKSNRDTIRNVLQRREQAPARPEHDGYTESSYRTGTGERSGDAREGTERAGETDEQDERRKRIGSEDEDEDEDAGPETVSSMAAKRQVRNHAAKIADTVRKKQEASSLRRRERHQLMSAGKMIPQAQYGVSDLPLLLPEELLATKAPIRTPTPESQEDRSGAVMGSTISNSPDALIRQRRNTLRAASPPTTKRIGPVTVKVLERPDSRLAPKMVKTTRVVRERLLRGRETIRRESMKASKRIGPTLQRVGYMKKSVAF